MAARQISRLFAARTPLLAGSLDHKQRTIGKATQQTCLFYLFPGGGGGGSP